MMTQRDRDRLVTLRKVKRGGITQRQAAEELGISERQVRRLVRRLKTEGDRAVIHGLRGRPSNRRISEQLQKRIVGILSQPVYRGFGPTLASEHWFRKYRIRIGRESLRKQMVAAGLWRARKRRSGPVHLWRPRRSRFGELVQWDTSDHDWLEGRGERIYLIHMLDDATSRLRARFVRHDTTVENMRLARAWIERYGRMVACYADQDSMFQTAPKIRRGESAVGREGAERPLTQIGRALQELGVTLIAAHSPQAKGRVERSFQTAQDRLVKELRVAGACSLEQANRVLEEVFLPWWEATCTVEPAHPDDAHRKLDRAHHLDAIFSIVETRRVLRDYTFRLDGKVYPIERTEICAGLRGALLRVERRLDGSLAVAFQGRYLRFRQCPPPAPQRRSEAARPAAQKAKVRPAKARSRWMDDFHWHQSLPIWRAATVPEVPAQEP
jgi:transposase